MKGVGWGGGGKHLEAWCSAIIEGRATTIYAHYLNLINI